ncbi:MAG: EFR1 family ferrodoxin [Elusimicrobia bacterium]|nr:EFR1 family ferrodoxin [Elusimicrobiota bacterium]
MQYKNVYVVYFSPAGGAKLYARTAAKIFSENFKETDITDFDRRVNKLSFDKDDLVIISAPAYFGRLVNIENGLLNNLSGNGARAMLLIAYGNRSYEDSLLELKKMAEERGFKPFAAAALLATPGYLPKVSKCRPNENDLALLSDFAEKSKAKLEDETAMAKDLSVKGNYPFRPYEKAPYHPEGDEKCNKCRMCFQICPMGAIDAESPKATDASKCISCMTCVQSCPRHSRGLHSIKAKIMLKMLERTLDNPSSRPEFFL